MASDKNAHDSTFLDELSYNFIIIILLLIAYWLQLSNTIIYGLSILLIIILLFNFFILIKGAQRQFILHRNPEEHALNHFFKYWIYFRIITPFFVFNTMSTIYRYITYPLRSYPDFYFLGPKKVGSTSLAHHFHSIGLHGPFTYWNNTVVFNKESLCYSGFLGLSTLFSHHSVYKLHFPFKFIKPFFGKNRLYFDADPAYFHLPHVRDRIYESTPNAKFIVLVRDPVERAISNFIHESRTDAAVKEFGLKQYPSCHGNIAKMINTEQSVLLKNERKKLECLGVNDDLPQTVNLVDIISLIQQSLYGKHLKRWMQKFKRNQFYIVDLHDLNTNLHDELQKICQFLNYPISKKELLLKCKPIHANKQSDKSSLAKIDKNTKEFQLLLDLIKKDRKDFVEIYGKNVDHWSEC